MDDPMISCICITKNNAFLLARAIDCFLAQTYNNRELLVVYEYYNKTVPLVKPLYQQDRRIRFMEIPKSVTYSLGMLRNITIEACHGDFFAQWDDDDWYGADRLAAQYQHLKNRTAVACFLSNWLMFDTTDFQGYMSFSRPWEGTILADCSVYRQHGLRYADLPREEDTPFMEALRDHFSITLLQAPWLYVYTYHGSNTWPYTHFTHNFRSGHKLSKRLSNLVNLTLCRGLPVGHASEQLQSETAVQEQEDAIALIDHLRSQHYYTEAL